MTRRASSVHRSFIFTDPATSEIYTLSLHDALPIFDEEDLRRAAARLVLPLRAQREHAAFRSEEHTSELQSLRHLVCRLLLEKKKLRRPRGRRFSGNSSSRSICRRPRAARSRRADWG